MPDNHDYIKHLITIAKSNIPEANRLAPWKNLNHGTNLLSTDLELWSYIAAYGEMHAIKCRSALQNFPFDTLFSTEIIDWGCGQGIATLCLLEMLKERNKLASIRKITLIEPSNAALQRAKDNISRILGPTVEIITHNKYLPGKDNITQSIDSLTIVYPTAIHLFSNILDIPTIDLAKLARLVSSNGNEHYVICTGPTNAGKVRIDEFCSYFHPDTYFSDIDSCSIAYTSDTHKNITCKTKAFKFITQNFTIGTVLNQSPTLPIGSQYTVYDEYNMSPEQDRSIPKRISGIYDTISKVLKSEDSIFICPSIGTTSVDLVIIRPQNGVVIINVCEEAPLDIVMNHSTQKSPFDIINTLKNDLITTHITGFYDMYLKDKACWWLVKTVICFPNYTRKQVIDTIEDQIEEEKAKKFTKNTAILGSDMLSETGINQLFSEIYFNYNNRRFTPLLRDNCIQFFAPSWHSYKDGRNDIILDSRQKELAKSQAGAKQKIRGVAGCGKTQILVERAVNAQIRTGRTVLILTFNITLINYILSRIGDVRKDFSWKKFEVINYQQFFNCQANRFGLKMDKYSSDNEHFFDKVANKIKKYSAIFIDEVQDYDSKWLKLVYHYFLDKDGEFIVFGDEKQNIFKRPLDHENKIIVPGIVGRWKELKAPHRSGNSTIINLAIDFQKKFLLYLNPDNIELNLFSQDGTIHYQEFQSSEETNAEQYFEGILSNETITLNNTVVLASKHELLRHMEYSCRVLHGRETQSTFERKEEWTILLQKYPVKNSNTSPFCDFRFKEAITEIRISRKRHFRMDTPGLKFSSIHSYKGWEAESVILLIDHEDHNDELIYTAITRAKKNLYILNIGNQRYKDFFKARTTDTTSRNMSL